MFLGLRGESSNHFSGILILSPHCQLPAFRGILELFALEMICRQFQEKINASSNRGRRRTLFFNLLSLISLRRRARVILSGTSADGNWIKLPSTLFPALPRSLLGYLGKELPIFRLARFPSFGRGFPSAGEKKKNETIHLDKKLSVCFMPPSL